MVFVNFFLVLTFFTFSALATLFKVFSPVFINLERNIFFLTLDVDGNFFEPFTVSFVSSFSFDFSPKFGSNFMANKWSAKI